MSLISTAEAVAITGYSYDTIAAAIKKGELVPVAERRPRGYYFARPDVIRWLSLKGGRRDQYFWSDGEVRALRDLYMSGTCTREQIAKYLGRGTAAVGHKIKELRASDPASPKLSKVVSPFDIPRRGILIAKTCPKCGELRDARLFPTTRPGPTGKYTTVCRRCRNEATQSRRQKDGRTSKWDKAAEAFQQATSAKAHNDHQRYGAADKEALADESRNDVEVAFALGRSYYAIRNKRQELGVGPFGSRPPRIHNNDARWVIQFNAELDSLRDHFRSIGQTAPEALHGQWEDWTDEQVAS